MLYTTLSGTAAFQQSGKSDAIILSRRYRTELPHSRFDTLEKVKGRLRQPSVKQCVALLRSRLQFCAWHLPSNLLRRTTAQSSGSVGGYCNRDLEENSGELTVVVGGPGEQYTRRVSFSTYVAIVWIEYADYILEAGQAMGHDEHEIEQSTGTKEDLQAANFKPCNFPAEYQNAMNVYPVWVMHFL